MEGTSFANDDTRKELPIEYGTKRIVPEQEMNLSLKKPEDDNTVRRKHIKRQKRKNEKERTHNKNGKKLEKLYPFSFQTQSEVETESTSSVDSSDYE